MSVALKKIVACMTIVLAMLGLAAFTQWGFDLSDWDPITRLGFGIMTIYLCGAAWFGPFEWDAQ